MKTVRRVLAEPLLDETFVGRRSHGGLERIKANVERSRRRLLVIEDNPAEQLSIAELLSHGDIDLITAGTGGDALKVLREQEIDCAVLDLRLPDMSGFDLLEMVRDDPALSYLPIVVFTGRELSPEEDAQLRMIDVALLSKASNRRSACSMKPRCSSTG